ncbi:trypsin-like serine protease [Nonomuraea sp. MTCD27]|uniref:S1 family peptidase n=1 Tax=Nonomuraea sp. MTCD27 TaxID=1676747 RepID=UPI0035C061CD
MRVLLRRGLAGLVAGGVMAAMALAAGPASGLAGGAAAPADGYGFVADVRVGSAVRGCSGALVDPEWIVTAKSCFVEGSDPVPVGPPSQPTTVTVGREDLTSIGEGQVRGVTHVVPHPARDLLLAKLASPVVEVTPVRVSATAPAPGEVLQVAGFGRTATEWVPERLHRAPFTVHTVNAGAVEITGDPSAPATICKGDAGGPAVRSVAAGFELVALHSASWQAGCLGTSASETRTAAVEVRLDNVRDWVRQTVRGGTFVRLPTSAAALDTRSGLGAPAGALAAGRLTPFQVTGVGGIPATGVSAVLVDVTAVTTAPTYLTLLPEGAPRPPLSMVNTTANQIISNTAVVPVPDSGKIAVYSHGPGAHAIVDVQGYYTTSGSTGRGFVAVDHSRLADTRSGLGGAAGIVPAGGSRTFTLTGGAIPAGASTAYLDLIVTGATRQGWVGAFPPGGANNRSVMDYVPGTTAHGVAVQLGTDGRATFTNNGGSAVHLVLTALGYFTGSADSGAGLRTIPAVRRLDTREVGTGVPLPANSTIDVPLGVPAGTTAALNLTVVGNTADGHLNAWPLDGTEASTSLVNYAPPADGARAGHTVVKVGTGGKIRIRNDSPGSAHVLVDLQGWYAADLVPAGGTSAAQTKAAEDVNVPGSVVEDFRYPGAESIEEIELIRGDGRITLVECTTDPQLITVESVGRSKFCFRVKGDTGWLSLRLDSVFLVGSGDQVVEATITADGEEQTVVVPEGQVRPTGTTDPDFAVLLELRASP